MAVLPNIVYAELDANIKQLIPSDFEHKIALIGGIQINTPENEEHYFVVKEFGIRLPAEGLQVSLREKLYHST